MLNSFYKAYLRKCFNDEMKCPVSITKIEFYLKLLLPAYRFSLVYQRNKSHIGDVLPGLLLLIEQYKSLGKKRGAGIFCSTFIKYLKKKFHYELNAPIYAIAALLNVSSLHMKYKKPFGKDYIKQAFDNLLDFSHLIDENESISNTATSIESTVSSTNININNDNDLDADLSLLFKTIIENQSDEDLNSTKNCMEKEREIFKAMLNEKFFNLTSSKFWLDNKKNFPNLYKLSLVLFNIPSSSAFVERFFSICGIVNNQRRGNMKDQNLINRAFLKTNIDLVE